LAEFRTDVKEILSRVVVLDRPGLLPEGIPQLIRFLLVSHVYPEVRGHIRPIMNPVADLFELRPVRLLDRRLVCPLILYTDLDRSFCKICFLP
jgi:hypothetical protein